MSTYLNVNEVAKLLGINPQTVYRLVWARKIPFTKIGRKVCFSEKAFEEWLEQASYYPKGNH